MFTGNYYFNSIRFVTEGGLSVVAMVIWLNSEAE